MNRWAKGLIENVVGTEIAHHPLIKNGTWGGGHMLNPSEYSTLSSFFWSDFDVKIKGPQKQADQ